jgi:predicted P-loop ATPase
MTDKPDYFTDEEWAEHLRQNGGRGQREKPDFLSDEEWAAWLRDHPDLGGKVVHFDQSKRKGKKPPPPPPGGWPSWLGRLRRDDRGRVIPDLANVLIALRNEEKLMMACGYDEMMQHSIVQREWPRAPDADPVQPAPHETNDDDIGRLQEWLQFMGMPRVGREIVGQAVEIFARERRFHPVRDWLEGLEWDGVNRIHRWLFTYFGAEAEGDSAIEYVGAIGKMFLIAMVARIFQPGCQADYMLVLEGDQGILKSTACRALAGQWFSDSLPRTDGDQVRLAMHLRGKWLIEVAELAAMLKGDPEGTKHFVSRQVEKYTPKYGRGEVTEPRQCLFIGTTNEDDYIRDGTGGRRYWPVKCTLIDVEGLAAVREQLLAEAVHRFNQGERWWPTAADEAKFFKPQQDRRQFDDALAERVHEIIDPRDPKTGKPLPQTFDDDGKPLSPPWEITLAALGGRLGFDNARFDMAAQKRVAAILKRAKWRKGHTHGGGKIWRKPELDRFCSNCGALEGRGCACGASFR